MQIWIPVVVAAVTGMCSMGGAMIAVKHQHQQLLNQIMTRQEVHEASMRLELKHLTEHVERQNQVIERTYQLEMKTERQEDELKRLNRRLEIVEGN